MFYYFQVMPSYGLLCHSSVQIVVQDPSLQSCRIDSTVGGHCHRVVPQVVNVMVSHVGVLMYSMQLMVLYQTSSDLSYGRRGRTAALCLRKTGLQSQVWILPQYLEQFPVYLNIGGGILSGSSIDTTENHLACYSYNMLMVQGWDCLNWSKSIDINTDDLQQ